MRVGDAAATETTYAPAPKPHKQPADTKRTIYAVTNPLLKGCLIVEHKDKLNNNDMLLTRCAAALLSSKLAFRQALCSSAKKN